MDSSVRGDNTKNNEYWKQRFELLENTQYDKSAAYYKDVQKQFQVATYDMQADIEKWYQRLADNNKISYAAAKKMLSKNELDEFHWSVEEYIKNGKENAINKSWMKQLENASAKVHISRLEAMKLQMQQHAELLFTQYEGGTGEFLNKSFQNAYYHTAYEVAKGTGVGTNFHRIDTRRINEIIRQPWAQDGANFSDRIWTNKEKLVNTLHNELTQNIIRGTSPRGAIDNIARTMEVSRSQAGVLVMTESAAIASAAQQKCLIDLGIAEYEIVATLDIKTSQICHDLDGMHFPMKDYGVGVTAPPFHPRCRTTTVPYFDDEFAEGEERAARDSDGKTYDVPANMTYSQWQNSYVSNEGLKAKESQTYQVPQHEKPKHLEKIDIKDESIVLSKLDEYSMKIVADIEKENAVAILQDGSILQCFGNINSVFPDYDIGDKLIGAYLTHNHPISETQFSFSSSDRQLFCDYQLQRLIGIDEKYTYVLTKDAMDIDEDTVSIFDLYEMSEQEQLEYASHSENIRSCKAMGIGYRRYKRT